MEQRPLGKTGLTVSVLGFGAGHIGGGNLTEDEVGSLLNQALDAGITLFDTARSYGASEERIGRHLSWRRREFVLSTKGGYGIEGVPEWTGPCITAGVDAALQRLRTDYIDIFHLHSCPVPVLEREDLQEALERAVQQGKVRVAAYSGDEEPLGRAILSGAFGSVEASLNLCDQRILEQGLPLARERGVGMIAKRPLANAPWRFQTRPGAQDIAVYWDRLRTLGLSPGDLSWEELALRFAAFQPGVSSCIVGSSRLDHLLSCSRALEQGPLSDGVLQEIRSAFARHGQGWAGQI